ncbi:uncharacterized protein LOC136069133 [Quercus suber]|uniref:uncharacterized protein LOC136069133 n=1 Tax=Quercus suber TaxID=58331 RepID=UPI0032DEF962
MGGDPSKRNQNLYCTYHKDKGHTTEQCRVLRDHFGQLVKARYLKEFVMDAGDRGLGQGTPQRGNPLPPSIGIIKVIHTTLGDLTVVRRKGVLTVIQMEGISSIQLFGKKINLVREPIAFDDNDLEGKIQPHDNALVVMTQISGFLVKKVMID